MWTYLCYGKILRGTLTVSHVSTPVAIECAIILSIQPFLLLLFCVQVHRYYRTSGGSINKAMGEAVTGAAKNEAVRGAVKSSVKAGVSAAMERE